MALKHSVVAAVAVILVITGSGIAQNVLAQFKITEAEARDAIIDELTASLDGHPNRPAADRARKAYASIPANARAQATAALYGWVKAYVNSPSFRTTYAAHRKNNLPVETPHPGTADEEVASLIAAEKAAFDKSVKDYLAAGMKAQAEAMQQQGKMLGDKSYLQMKKIQVDQQRASDKQRYDGAMAIFNEKLPADPIVRIAAHLRAFVTATPDVDFAAKQQLVDGSVSSFLVFVNPAYNKKPWQWQVAYAFGPEAIGAARTAAQAWLREIEK
jgi:hypothetical protein